MKGKTGTDESAQKEMSAEKNRKRPSHCLNEEGNPCQWITVLCVTPTGHNPLTPPPYPCADVAVKACICSLFFFVNVKPPHDTHTQGQEDEHEALFIVFILKS